MTTLRVPLAIRLPRERYPQGAPRVVREYVSQLDVYPTLLRLLGVPRPPIQDGTALLAADGAAEKLAEERTFFAETGEWLWPTAAIPRQRLRYPPVTSLATLEKDRIVIEEEYLPVIRAAKHRAAIRPPYKLVYRPGPEGVEYGLYDIERDPREEHDLSRREPARLAELKDALRRSVLRFPSMIAEGDYFLTRPAPPPEEYW
jgi:arylsulfatase A-like enzyme